MKYRKRNIRKTSSALYILHQEHTPEHSFVRPPGEPWYVCDQWYLLIWWAYIMSSSLPWGSDKPELAHTSQIDESDVHLLEKMLNTSLKNFIILFFAGFALPVYSVSIPTLHLGASTLDLTNGSEQLTKRRTISNAALIDGDQYKCHLRCLPHRPANPPNRGCDTADRCRKAGEQVSWQGQFFRESPVALPYPSLTTLSFICFDRPSLRSGAVLTRCDDLVITTPCPLRGWCLCLYVSGADFLRNRLSCFNFKKNKHKFSICAIRTLLLHNTPDYIQL